VGAAVSDYFAAIAGALADGPPSELDRAADVLLDAIRSGRAIYTFGNGACAALAGHMATDLGKGLGGRARIVSLVENASLLTAYANDHDYDCVFEQPLRALLRPADVALGLSGSGRSPNVLAALEYARAAGGRTIAFTGSMDGTERLTACCDVVVRAPLTVMEQIEDLHVIYSHVLLRTLKERLP
jgi:D-sedoheptulose 7-phosphate isomerase